MLQNLAKERDRESERERDGQRGKESSPRESVASC